MKMDLRWLGHAGFMLKGKKTVYIDPYKSLESEPADIILVTHSHFDHCSPEDIGRLRTKDTVVIAPGDCQIEGKRTLSPGQSINIGDIAITAVPAYNPTKKFHPKANNWVGYVVKMEGTTVYHAGDTDVIPEMADLGPIGYALLPVGGTYTMTAEEAARAVQMIKPKIAIPMHYGSVVGSSADAEKFKRLCKCDVRIGKI
jgi:L-ascorbate metabolism protein UlaG (beta-lactamase superfamily)